MMLLGIVAVFVIGAVISGLELVGVLPGSTIAWGVFVVCICCAGLATYSDYIDRQNHKIFGVSQVRTNEDQAT